jgi:hypothetical protein
MLDRVFVLVSSPVSLLLTGLLQLFLRFGICEAETEFDSINLIGDVVKVIDDLLSNVAAFKSNIVSRYVGHVVGDVVRDIPSKANLLADPRIRFAADLSRDSMVGFEMVSEILDLVSRFVLLVKRTSAQPHSTLLEPRCSRCSLMIGLRDPSSASCGTSAEESELL